MAIFVTDPTSHTENNEVDNLGDFIIKEAIIQNLPSQLKVFWEPIVGSTRSYGITEDRLLLGGANIIGNRPFFNPSVWRPSWLEVLKRDYLVLMGVGWWQYQKFSDFITQLFYRRVLAKDFLHSVRDGYTEMKLRKMGAKNILNTGCPTMWGLPDHLDFKSGKKDSVIFTLTDYSPAEDQDRDLVSYLFRNYSKVLFFPQGVHDISYLKRILSADSLARIEILPRTLASFDAILGSEDIDYVGTRLHAGIRSLQRGRRAIVISVDNRAVEISRDTQLPVVPRGDLAALDEKVTQLKSCDLKLPRVEIKQFKDSLAALSNFNGPQ